MIITISEHNSDDIFETKSKTKCYRHLKKKV